MNIFSFSEDKDSSKPYQYKVLIYPNITWAKDLNKDSFVVVTNNIIKNLEKIRNDIHWTILLPESLACFNQDNIDQVVYKVPTYPNQMRCHFDTQDFLNIIQWKKNDFDLVYTHLPEHTLQIKNVFNNVTNIKPGFVGYSHWTEFPEITEYPMTVIDHNFLGLLEMDVCGINTKAQKDLVLKHAKKHFNQEVVDRLDNIVVPQYLGWEVPSYESAKKTIKTIVFNHRPHEYKSYPWFIEQMDVLWKERQDFRVWVPLAETPDREFIDVGMNSTRKEYFSNLSGCLFGVCGKQKYAGWSVSATDGMSVGVPYVFADEEYYKELAGQAGMYFSNDEGFLSCCRTMLDNPHVRLEHSNRSDERFKESTWDKKIIPINKMLQTAFDNLPKMSEKTDSYKEIVKFIKKNKSVTKNDILEYLGWGVRIAWSPYRNLLREEKNIVFLKNRYEYVDKSVDKKSD
jgi:glycosyltransferase involved in cell wall biosynthesis